LLSSECARRDYALFMADEPGHVAQPRVMHFFSCLVGEYEMLKKNKLMAQYGLPENWFYLPNQFWEHKNHTVVIEALNALRVQGKKICIVATGSKDDHRNPGYFDALMDSVRQQQLEDQFVCLGMVPYPHMLALMKYAMAVINPSLFEGWSTSVEEAKALGKNVILSGIPVHREQNPERACFFEVDDSHTLATIMSRVAECFDASDDKVLMRAAEAKLADHRKTFGKQYESIILDCISQA
jgi:glycosyltransferase involved in cell wall biosynthesis